VRPARLHATPFRLPLREPLATAHGILAFRSGLLLRLEDPDGLCGYGEATPVEGFGPPEAVVRAAREVARLDLDARRAGRPLVARLAGGARARRTSLRVGRLLAGDGDALCRAAQSALAAGHRTLKLKLDGRDPAAALARVERLRKAVGPTPRIRVDSGGTFAEEAARRAALRLADLGVELWEEPVRAGDLAALRRLRALGAVAIAADESAATPEGADRVLAAEAADVIVLKPSLLGVAPALAVARRARERGIATLVTSALDGALGRATALAVAAVLPDDGFDPGLATDALLADDLADEPAARAGRMELPRGAGLGIVPDPAAVERLRSGPDLEPPP
jgi:muconate cycloisomerase